MVEEDLQTPPLHADEGETLHAMWCLDVPDALRQQQWRPQLGADPGASRLPRRVDAEPVEGESRVGRQDGTELGHGDRFDRQCFCGAFGGSRDGGRQSTDGQGGGSQDPRAHHQGGLGCSGRRPRSPGAQAPCPQSHVLMSFHPITGSTGQRVRKIEAGRIVGGFDFS
jgi:hypothetical protein